MALKPVIIKIKLIKDAIPKEKVWYSYYDDIFVSVICENNRTSHIRRKNATLSNRKDSIMSAWHCDWQYNQIESTYGTSAGRKKTYEIPISFNGERHIIDSVIENIAIEFQHTLGVSTKELDLRFHAHTAFGLVPYLVLNFTSYTIPERCKQLGNYSQETVKKLVKRKDLSENDLRVWRTMLKWTSCKHYEANNLFLEFQNGLVRFHEDLTNGCLITAKHSFLSNLELLDDQLASVIKNDFETKELQRLKEEKDQEEKKAKRLLEIAEEEEDYRRARERAHRQHIFAKQNDDDYINFRSIIGNLAVKKYLKPFDFDKLYIQSERQSLSAANMFLEISVYLCQEENLLMIYETNVMSKSRAVSVEHNYSKIIIVRRVGFEIKTFTFSGDFWTPWRIVEKRVELVKDYLHSLSDAALITYDRLGNRTGKYYYIHNHLVDEDIFSPVSSTFDCPMIPIELLKVELSNHQFERLKLFNTQLMKKEDKYRFVAGIATNYGITEDNITRYYSDNEIDFNSELIKQFFFGD